ncbi:MAG: LptA/OstA family protein [Pseudomonadota bacterium]
MIRAPFLLSLGVALACAAPAHAQSRHDTNAPIDFSAEHGELQDREGRAVLNGNVRISQAEMTLTAARVTVSFTGQVIEGSPQVSRLDAAGGVTLTRPDQNARADFATYDLNRRVITLIGGVTLRQGVNTLQGGRVTIDLDTGRATMDGSSVRGSTDGTTRQNGRVSGRFSVPKRNDD